MFFPLVVNFGPFGHIRPLHWRQLNHRGFPWVSWWAYHLQTSCPQLENLCQLKNPIFGQARQIMENFQPWNWPPSLTYKKSRFKKNPLHGIFSNVSLCFPIVQMSMNQEKKFKYSWFKHCVWFRRAVEDTSVSQYTKIDQTSKSQWYVTCLSVLWHFLFFESKKKSILGFVFTKNGIWIFFPFFSASNTL